MNFVDKDGTAKVYIPVLLCNVEVGVGCLGLFL